MHLTVLNSNSLAPLMARTHKVACARARTLPLLCHVAHRIPHLRGEPRNRYKETPLGCNNELTSLSGLGLVTALAEREDTVVFAGARNPDDATALHALVNKCPGNIHIVKLTAGDEVGNRAAVAEVKTKAGRLDVVIANAGKSHELSLSEKAALTSRFAQRFPNMLARPCRLPQSRCESISRLSALSDIIRAGTTFLTLSV